MRTRPPTFSMTRVANSSSMRPLPSPVSANTAPLPRRRAHRTMSLWNGKRRSDRTGGSNPAIVTAIVFLSRNSSYGSCGSVSGGAGSVDAAPACSLSHAVRASSSVPKPAFTKRSTYACSSLFIACPYRSRSPLPACRARSPGSLREPSSPARVRAVCEGSRRGCVSRFVRESPDRLLSWAARCDEKEQSSRMFLDLARRTA